MINRNKLVAIVSRNVIITSKPENYNIQSISQLKHVENNNSQKCCVSIVTKLHKSQKEAVGGVKERRADLVKMIMECVYTLTRRCFPNFHCLVRRTTKQNIVYTLSLTCLTCCNTEATQTYRVGQKS